MTLAIIDGGSTKADWLVRMPDGSTRSLTTTGFNPNYDKPDKIQWHLAEDTAGILPTDSPLHIHYYGTGCWDPSRKKVVSDSFKAVFPQATVQVDHDLLGAAKATCGDSPGIACILGTGSNSVLFDGQAEVDNVTNLGFMLGDEGSGSMLGKRLVQAYFYREMPAELQYIMQEECPRGRLDILDRVYGGGVPAAYLATFAQKYHPHKNHPFVWKLIKDNFDEFLTRHVMKYNDYQSLPIHFVGSVAHHFQEILQELMTEKGLSLGVVLTKPIGALFDYHVSKMVGSA